MRRHNIKFENAALGRANGCGGSAPVMDGIARILAGPRLHLSARLTYFWTCLVFFFSFRRKGLFMASIPFSSRGGRFRISTSFPGRSEFAFFEWEPVCNCIQFKITTFYIIFSMYILIHNSAKSRRILWPIDSCTYFHGVKVYSSV